MAGSRGLLVLIGAIATLAAAGSASGAEPWLQRPGAGTETARAQPIAHNRAAQARQALAEAEALFRRDRIRSQSAQWGRSATLILRELALHLTDLPPEAQLRAQGILARPFSDESTLFPRPDDPVFGHPPDPDQDEAWYAPSVLSSGSYWFRCSRTRPVCVNFVTATEDAISLADADRDGLPDYLEAVENAIETVWDWATGELGLREPRSDARSENHGVDGRLDVYLVDLPARLYGYCASDDPKLDEETPPSWDVSAYCVFDNDYSPSEYGLVSTPIENLQVTVAHELFHAFQLAYDVGEDDWLMEGTAAWAEDEVYDEVDDNLQYLAASPIAHPHVPLDTADGAHEYGAWIFFRFLSETLGGPAIVRRIWEHADGAAGAPDHSSLEAVQLALAERGRTLADALAAFHLANAFPWRAYEEGKSYGSPPLADVRTISRARKRVSSWLVLDHLTGGYVLLRPGRGVGPDAKLRLTVDLPRPENGVRASVAWITKSGSIRAASLPLDRDGIGGRTLPFGSVRAVLLVLTNAGARYDCWTGTPFACQGTPLDDDRVMGYGARLARR